MKQNLLLSLFLLVSCTFSFAQTIAEIDSVIEDENYELAIVLLENKLENTNQSTIDGVNEFRQICDYLHQCYSTQYNLSKSLYYLDLLIESHTEELSVDTINLIYAYNEKTYMFMEYERMGEAYENAEILYDLCNTALQTDSVIEYTMYALNAIAMLSYKHKEDYKKAAEYFDKCLEHIKSNNSISFRFYGLVLNNYALMYEKSYQLEKAEKLYLNGITIDSTYLDSLDSDRFKMLHNLSSLYSKKNQLEKSHQLRLIVLDGVEKLEGKNSDLYQMSNYFLGILYEKMGRYAEAFKIHMAYLEHVKLKYGEYSDSYVWATTELAHIYGRIGNEIKSLDLSIRAMEIADSVYSEDQKDYVLTLNNASTNILTLDPKKALQIAEKAVKIELKYRGATQDYGSLLCSLGDAYEVNGNYEKSIQTISKGLSIIENLEGKRSNQYIMGLASLGISYLSNKEFSLAEQTLLEAITILGQVRGKRSNDYIAILYNLSAVYLENQEINKAIPICEEVLDLFKSQIALEFPFLNDDEQTKFISNLQLVNNKYHSKSLKDGDTKVELAKLLYEFQIYLKELIVSYQDNLMAWFEEHNDEEVKEVFTNWKVASRKLIGSYSLLKDQDEIKVLEREVESYFNELTEHRMDKTFLADKVETNIIQKELNSNEAAIEFVNFQYYNKEATDTNFYAAILLLPESENVEYILLFEEKELLSSFDSSRQTQTQEQIKNLYAHQSGLYNLIWSKLEPYLNGIETVYFSPSGLLHKINFNAIQDEEDNYLMNQYNLVQLNSTREIIVQPEEQFHPKNASIALYGNIDYNLSEEDRLLAEAQNYSGQNDTIKLFAQQRGPQIIEASRRKTLWRSIVGSKREVKEIRKLWPNRKAKLLEAQEANEQTFKAMEGERAPDICHLATHGFFFEETQDTLATTFGESTYRASGNPLLRSGLILAGGNYVWGGSAPLPDKEDGILTALEISNLNLLNTELVVLSACESGLGDIKGSEGVFGLQRAFKMAGVDNLIMSLWKVPDAETEQLMTQFYKNWNRGYDLRSAFKKAQQKMAENYSPYYWAGFVLIGEVEEERVPGKRLPNGVWFLGGILGLGLLGFGIKKVA